MKALLQLFAIVFFTIQLNAQQINISGVVLDNSGMPLPGVNIIEKGTSNGTQSNFDGKYTITAKTGGTLAFSYVGFTTFEKKIKKNISILNVTLKQDAAQLEEVVVTTAGIKKEKKSLGYAVSSSDDQKVVIRGMSSLSGSVNGISGAANHITVRNNTNLDTDNEAYGRIQENIFKRVEAAPFSTFSIDVDKAGYSNIRRFINNGQEVPQDAVKIEEMINYFSYDYPQPSGDDPFSISTEVASSPWNADAKLVRIGIKGKDVSTEKVPASNLVFLLDVSGSMNNPNKLPLLKSALHILVNQLRETDKVSIVVYAGAAGLVLEPTSGINKKEIMQAIDKLSAGGSTSGGEGIALAYKIAEDNFIKGGNNRVILATDGDFNVGASSDRAMENLISEKRENGVFLTCLGFGMGNYKDSKMETLADKGNGNHAYIDTMQEAHKVLGTEFFGTIYTIAKDVKIQVEFNPGKVQAYRLVGYENRLLNDEDFKDDTKDAGELGSGHTVTALYEIIPVGVKSKYNKYLPELKYTKTSTIDHGNEMLTVKFRYKEPDGNKSKMIEKTVMDRNTNFEKATEDFKYAASVALFGMQLRNSEFINSFETNDVITMAEAGKGTDKDGYRAEFIRLVKSYN